jgi:hypothetical protein
MPSTDRKLELKAKTSVAQTGSQPFVYAKGLKQAALPRQSVRSNGGLKKPNAIIQLLFVHVQREDTHRKQHGSQPIFVIIFGDTVKMPPPKRRYTTLKLKAVKLETHD